MTAAARRQLLAKVHMGKAALKMDEDVYRLLLNRVAGAGSAADLRVPQLVAVVEEMKHLGWSDKPKAPKRAGTRPQAADPQSAKIRALWLALYHLGEVKDPEEAALASFAQRQTGVAALQFLTVAQGRKVIEVLKSWCRRVGYDVPSGNPLQAKVRLLCAIWVRMQAVDGSLGTVRMVDWLSDHGQAVPPSLMTEAQLDQAAEAMGKAVRAGRAK